MRYMGLEFTHEPLSVSGDAEKFAAINPVRRAPTLVLDDGLVLMESSLILEFLERLVPPERSLMPQGIKDFARAQRIVALALTACDKAVQIALEEALRPVEKRYQPVIDVALDKVRTAFRLLEAEMGSPPDWFFGTKVMQADITTVMAWGIARLALGDRVTPAAFPRLAAFAERAEKLPEFVASPAS
jgi:glutathione S-transferase